MRTDKEKELDDLFKGGLEDPSMNTNFREGDWEDMEALLDDNKKRRGIVYWPIISSIAAMLLLALGWFLVKNNGDKPQITKNPTVIQNKAHKTDSSVTGSTVAQQELAAVEPRVKDTISSATIANATNKPPHRQDTISFKNGSAKRYVADVPNTKNERTATSSVSIPQLTNEAIINNAKENNLIAQNKGKEILVANTTALDLQGINNTELSASSALPTNKPQIVAAYVKDKGNAAIKQLNPNRPQFAITILASPDINGVNTFKNSQMGTNAGLMFSMGLGKRFTISTGAVYAKKPYITNFSDYHQRSATSGSYGYSAPSSGKVTPVDVSADCRVLDIPVNVDYTVYNRSNNKFSIGSGLSSYIMLRENYHYNYSTTPGPSSPTEYDIANKNQHILGVLNLQATYARRLSSKFSLGVQPYLKVPLTDIGYSQVKLQSTGVAVGLTWNINSPPK